MAASVTTSAWGKPGAWALDSEEHEEELKQETPAAPPTSEFPDLMTAAATKTKKKKGQTVSLHEFVAGGGGSKQTSSGPQGLTTEDMMNLPTGPRQRSAEEMDRTRLGNGFRSYGDRNESNSSRWGPKGGDDGARKPTREPLGPSRADEISDWGAQKKSLVGGGGGGHRDRSFGFSENSHSRADESDRWASNKTSSFEGRRNGGGFDRERRPGMGFESNGDADTSDNWARKKEAEPRTEPRRFGSGSGSAFDSLRDRRVGNGNDSTDTDTWAKKREEVTSGGGSRPKLNLQPRKVPVGEAETVKVTKGSNPFGDARPREEVLKEKGEDWKEMDEKLEAMKIKDLSSGDRMKRGLGRPKSNEDSTEGSWRKNQSVEGDAVPPSGENNENGHTEEQPGEEEEDAQK